MTARSIRLVLLVTSLLPAIVVAEARGDWIERDHLTGNAWGVRSALADRGVRVHALYTSGVSSNVRGGLDTGARYIGFADWGIDTDLEKLVGWQSARFFIDWHSYHGGQPAERLIGSFPSSAVSGIEAEQSVRFYQIFLEQRFLDGRVLAKVGQLALDQDFMVTKSAQMFRNASFGDFTSNSVSDSVAVYPLAAPGFYLAVEPFPRWQMRLGVYSADLGADEKDNFGFDWTISANKGVTISAEVETQQSPFGLMGSITVGTLIVTGEVENFETGGESDGSSILYAMIDQTLIDVQRGETEIQSRLSGFLRIMIPTRRDRTETEWLLNGGLTLDGPLPGREKDTVALGVTYTAFTHDYVNRVRGDGLRVTSSSIALELTYRAQIAGWLTIQPDVQYFIDPHFGRSDALALGLLVVIDL